MQICRVHWIHLREAIENRGLMQFTNKDGVSASKEISEAMKQVRDETKPYDPLLSANFQIWAAAVKAGGTYMMSEDLCPLCEMETHTQHKAEDWINPCCDAIVDDFRKRGWLPKPS